jgi:phage tail sheath gpL-like
VQKGNCDSTHLNKTGYSNIITRFKDKTGLLYTRKQFKNKWDTMKTDYGIWKLITKETSLGWSASGKDIDMTTAWWKETTKVCD